MARLLEEVLRPVLVDEHVRVPRDVERHEGSTHRGHGEGALGEGGDVIVAGQRGQTEKKDETIVYLRLRYLLNCNLNPVVRRVHNLHWISMLLKLIWQLSIVWFGLTLTLCQDVK